MGFLELKLNQEVLKRTQKLLGSKFPKPGTDTSSGGLENEPEGNLNQNSVLKLSGFNKKILVLFVPH